MIKLIKEIFQVGEATIAYPFAPIPLSPGFRGKPVHAPEACVACAACCIACPSNALSMSNDTRQGTRTWSICYGRCIFCGRCEEVCPTSAISLTPDFELAVMKKEDLISRAHFKLSPCRVCGRFFAPAKEIEYALSLLKQAGLPPDEIEGRREALETCPECKRLRDVPKVKSALSAQLAGVTR